ncbi:MAG: class I adenylate-forming enzyme family protein [Phycisphaerales bacterium]
MQFGLSESVDHWGRYRPNSIAVYCNGSAVSYGQLNSRVNALCRRVQEEGFSAPRIAVALSSKVNTLTAYLAVLRLGRSIVVLNPALRDEALRTNLSDTNASELIHDTPHSHVAGLFASAPRAVSLDAVDWSKTQLEQPLRDSNTSDEWGVLFSSGSTGTPKGVERDQYSMVTEFIGWCLELTLSRRTTFYIGRPIFYTGGLVLAGATLLVGGSIVLNDHGDDNDVASTWSDYQAFVRAHPTEWSFFVPDQLRAFMRFATPTVKTPGSRGVVVMGAPITGDEKRRVREVLGSDVVESWGNSESLGTITDPEDLDVRPQSVGRPFLTDALVVVDEDGKALPPMTLGRIAGGEEAGFEGYSNRLDATARVKRNALIISDDIGYLDDQGYLFVRGREQESFVCDGKDFFVGELERALLAGGGFRAVAIVPLGSDTGSAVLRALVVQGGENAVTPAELHLELNRRLPKPLAFEKVVFVDHIPHTPSRKVDRAACRRQALETP